MFYLQVKIFSCIIKIGDRMYVIKENIEHELIIKNSRFITLIYQIKTKEEVDNYLKVAKEKYPKATHYTYAYKTMEEEKSSDDKEPSGTAGIPILNVIQKQEIVNVLVIVIRYFGGIKLGAGGLVRAYTKSCKEALCKASLLSLIPAKKVKIKADYTNQKELDYLLQSSKVLEKTFTDTVTYIALVENETILDHKFSYEIIGTSYIEKEL